MNFCSSQGVLSGYFLNSVSVNESKQVLRFAIRADFGAFILVRTQHDRGSQVNKPRNDAEEQQDDADQPMLSGKDRLDLPRTDKTAGGAFGDVMLYRGVRFVHGVHLYHNDDKSYSISE